MTSLQHLPLEILCQISGYLSQNDIDKVSEACKEANNGHIFWGFNLDYEKRHKEEWSSEAVRIIQLEAIIKKYECDNLCKHFIGDYIDIIMEILSWMIENNSIKLFKKMLMIKKDQTKILYEIADINEYKLSSIITNVLHLDNIIGMEMLTKLFGLKFYKNTTDEICNTRLHFHIELSNKNSMEMVTKIFGIEFHKNNTIDNCTITFNLD